MQGGQYSGGFGLGLEDNFSQVPSKTQGQAQEYFGADTTAPVQTEDAGGYGATYSSAVGEYGAEDAGQATWEQVQQWVDYYRQEGYTEDQLQDWIASTYPQFAQQHAHKETIELLENTEAAETTPAQEQTHVSQTDKGAAEGQGPSADERLLRGFAEAPGDQLRGSTTGPTAEVAGYGTEHEVPGIDRSKIQSETLSNMADCGSSRGHLDDVASVRMVSSPKHCHNEHVHMCAEQAFRHDMVAAVSSPPETFVQDIVQHLTSCFLKHASGGWGSVSAAPARTCRSHGI